MASEVAGVVYRWLPSRRPRWLERGGRWPLAVGLIAAAVVLLSDGALFYYRHPPTGVGLCVNVVVLALVIARLHRVPLWSLGSFVVMRLRTAAITATVIAQWVISQPVDTPTVLYIVRATFFYCVGEVVLATLLVAALDPYMRSEIHGWMTGAGFRGFIGGFVGGMLLICGGWSAHYLFTPGPLRLTERFEFEVVAVAPGDASSPRLLKHWAAQMRAMSLPPGIAHDDNNCLPVGDLSPGANVHQACFTITSDAVTRASSSSFAEAMRQLDIIVLQESASCSQSTAGNVPGYWCEADGSWALHPLGIDAVFRDGALRVKIDMLATLGDCADSKTFCLVSP